MNRTGRAPVLKALGRSYGVRPDDSGSSTYTFFRYA
jgi:hypothetical protein